jgi:hypothetical protein
MAAAASGEDMTWFVTTTAIPYWGMEIGYHYIFSNERQVTYLVGESQQRSQKFAKMALPSRQFPAPIEVRSIQSSARVHN